MGWEYGVRLLGVMKNVGVNSQQGCTVLLANC